MDGRPLSRPVASLETDEDFEAALDRFISSEREALADTTAVGRTEEETVPVGNDEPEEADASLLASLDPLTGLRSVKEKLTVYERVVRFNRMRARKGLPVPPFPLHAMFLGSPGTGRSSSS